MARKRAFLLRLGFALAALGVAAHGAHALFGWGGAGADAFFKDVVYTGVEALACVLCSVRALTVRRDRGAWTAMSVALWAYFGGDLVWTLWLNDVASPPFPSVADGLYYVSYACDYVALVALLRSQVHGLRATVWLDGVISGLAVAAVTSAFVFEPVARATRGSLATVACTLAYPALDVLLLCLVVIAFCVCGWRPGRAWLLIGAGLILMAGTDAVYVVRQSAETYQAGTILDTGWPAALLIIAAAAWQRSVTHTVDEAGWRAMAVATVATIAAVATLTLDTRVVGNLATGLAVGALLAGIARAIHTFAENFRLLRASRLEALCDALTGLPNRRALLARLEHEASVASPSRPCTLIFFDLDGFKPYNDGFGHAAGDALLARLGTALAGAVAARGQAYRLGGDEFCVLAPERFTPEDELVTDSVAALCEHGEGFEITSSFGLVVVPDDAPDAPSALQLADTRMYEHKHRRGLSDRRHARDVLLGVLLEREPDLHEHMDHVGALALAVGRELGLDNEELDVVVRAAELHDVGKLAIPDEILDKPGPLSNDDWRLMREHTRVGERILLGTPALRPVAGLVRASHERWDGRGYPDGLAGDAIPRGARIVAVCDAYDAMLSDRAYRRALTPEAGLAELRRCAGSQFEPAVVAAVERVLASGGRRREAAAVV